MPTPVPDLHQVVDPAVRAAGLVLDGLLVRRVSGRTVVEVTVDLRDDDTGTLDLDRIEQVSRLVAEALDADDVVVGEYVLEVGSPGTARPLVRPAQFRRNVGRRLEVTTDDGPLVGRLVDVTETGIVVVGSAPAAKGRRPRDLPPVTLSWDRVRSARVEVDMTGLGRDEED
jgi:ribosome maturation factor RimP